MKKYIIDTDLYIELLRTGKYHDLIDEIYSKETPFVYFSSVVAQELMSGIVSIKGKKNVEALLRPFERVGRIATPEHNAWKDAGEVISVLRKKMPNLKTKLPKMINDALIAMSARNIGATVVTLNHSDFKAIQSVKDFSFSTVR